MSLTKVVITPEVYLSMCTHALTTEAEEVMGLLLGDIRAGEGNTLVAFIRRAIPQIRTDRRKDRVETSPEQMAACTALAESLTSSSGLFTRVVGWYHSHPHITVLPSHVDVSTQAMYQRFDQGFIGLIFSVFNTNPVTQEQTVQLTAFQAVQGAAADQQQGSALEGVGSGELDGLDEQMRAALAASAADMQQSSQDSWHRREVPLEIAADSSNPASMRDYVEVQEMLLAEEVAAHKQVTASSTSSSTSSIHQALLQLLDAASHQQALLQHAECVLAPALQVMRQMAAQQQLQAQQLEAENTRLKELLPQRAASREAPATATGPTSHQLADEEEGSLISLDSTAPPPPTQDTAPAAGDAAAGNEDLLS